MSNPNNSTAQISPSQFDAQFVLIVITVVLQLFQTIVTGIKLRVRCRDCFCSMRPKNSSPGGSSDSSGGSPKRAADDPGSPVHPGIPSVAVTSAAAAAAQDQGGKLEVSLTPRTAAAVAAAVVAGVAAATPRTSVSLSESVVQGMAASDGALRTPVAAKRGSATIERSRTFSSADQMLQTPVAVRRSRTPSVSSAPSPTMHCTEQPNNRKRTSVPPIQLESVVIDEQ